MAKVILGIKFYTLAEVSQLLNVTPSSVTKYIHNGKITPTTIGARKYVTEENLKKFLQNAV